MMESIAVPLGVSLVGLIAWLVRLEAKENRNAEVIKELQIQVKEHIERCEFTQDRILETLIEIKARLKP